ncbi:hypothetical protein PR048_016409 [Dryococelus australis]|uniref:Uncharacterized protein n=1 Tax=Dryococelus australis TaxID=614101 RepID=A0ABQ9HJP4_9NEOP|nr:hypothetical protein PR048_016409 [Dryococelus australis]
MSDVFGLDELPLSPVSTPGVTTSAEKTKQDLIDFVTRRLFLAAEKRSKKKEDIDLARAVNISKQWEHITRKLLPLFAGSYVISRVINKNFYEL